MSNTAYYGGFIGIDATGDPKAVARNRLAYCVNMWRDYESEQGAAVETFPGFRRVMHSLGLDKDGGEIGAVHGLYHFRSRRGIDYVVVHAGSRLYCFENEALASGDYEEIAERSAIISTGVADADSTGFIFNNNLYILDGAHYLAVTDVGEQNPSIKASAVDAYVPTTYFNGNIYEQRNMLTDHSVQIETGQGQEMDKAEAEIAPEDIFYVSEGKNYGFINAWDGQHLDSPAASFYYMPQNASTMYVTVGAKENVRKAYLIQDGGTLRIGWKEAYGSGGTTWGGGFEDFINLEEVYIVNKSNTYGLGINIEEWAFKNCPRLKKIYISSGPGVSKNIADGAIPEGVELIENKSFDANKLDPFAGESYSIRYPIYDLANYIEGVTADGEEVNCLVEYNEVETVQDYRNGEATIKSLRFRPGDVTRADGSPKKLEIKLKLKGTGFVTVAGLNSFKDGNPDYKKSTIDAINGCTVSAVYDGRVFLTGNGELPNTVFFTQRNLTGANDPAYIGIYNYFNDGVGNTPNVDMLATPAFLMVIKKDTVQDGSVYYHVGQNNTDETYMNILPRLYPSTSGASGLGSAGGNTPSRLSCNFLDDPVFLSKRGVECVGKEQVNLERTIQHRSSNVDRLLIKEDLARASLAEWKGYLVICCNGHMYLADSRYISPHADGSYQYEWYYLEGLGTYEGYRPRWVFWMDFWPIIDPEGMTAYTLGDFLTLGGRAVREEYKLRDREDIPEELEIHTVTVVHPEDDSYTVPLYYAERDGVKYLVGWATEEKVGVGRFFGATKILTVGERLYFGTDNGDVCVINTDKRGVSVGERVVEHDRIDRSFYSFNGVAYLSGCSTRLDDCDGKGVVKNTECGTTAIRFKMMPGSRARINVTLNGRDWHTLGEAFNSRFDFTDLQFSNFSFGENENNVVVIPELTRGWVQKQYYVYNDRFEEPFGIYELSYAYYVYGKIHY